MGAKLSTTGSANPTASYGVLIKNTARDRELLERFFLTFLQTVTPKEMRELYSINQCNKYAFLMAQSLQKFFKATPVKGTDPSKLVYYVRMEGRTKEEHNKEFYVNCFQVGYFYIRMLQIFCALALTVSTKGSMDYTTGPVQRLPSEFVDFPGLMGGKIDSWDDIPEILESYLIDGRGPRFKNQSRLYYEDGKIQFRSSSGDKIILECRIRKSISQIQLTDFEIDGKIVKDTDGKPVLRTIDIDKKDGRYMYYKGLKEYKALDARILEIIQVVITAFEKGVEKKPGTTSETASRYIGPERFELSVESIVDRLKGTSSKPYAIARALQLLDLQPTYSYDKRRGAQYQTHVFDYAYSSIIGNAPFIGSAAQLKEFNASSNNLENVVGLRALEKLYYDNVENIEDKGISDGDKYRIKPANEEEYWGFLKTIDCIYKETSISKEHEGRLKEKSKAVKDGLIMFKVENKEKGVPGTKILSTADAAQKRVIALVQRYQAQLFGYQQQHTREVMAFIQKHIIAVGGARGFKLNDNFIRVGIPYINAVGEQARRLLLNYYVRCEALYSQAYHVIKTNGMSPGPDLLTMCRSTMS